MHPSHALTNFTANTLSPMHAASYVAAWEPAYRRYLAADGIAVHEATEADWARFVAFFRDKTEAGRAAEIEEASK